MPKAPKEKKFICSELKKDNTFCGQVCRSKWAFNDHVHTHMGEKPHVYPHMKENDWKEP
jgi:hypothetical protein